ncbi:MAG: aldo/keto reductase [Blastococcus sp.]|jgi:D-threo-aldose 1-dehydrogenase|nr:aldo/keto reductase [Blastococcus sp.]
MSTVGPVDLGPLGYGAAAVGNLYRAVDDESARRLLDAAWDSGIRYYDTSPHYGLGLSERRLGEMLRQRPRADFVVSTKVGRLLIPDPDGATRRDDDIFEVPADFRRVWDFSEGGIRRSLEESLVRLGLDRVDVLYLHDVERSPQGIPEAVDSGIAALVRMREEGLVRAIGVGTKDLGAVERAVRTDAIDLVMLPGRYTLLETPAKDVVLPLCQERGVGIVNVAVFNSGLLASPDPGEEARYEYLPVPADKLRRAQELARACRELGVELPTAALHFSARHPAMVSVVVGADTPEQIRQNVARMRSPVPDELWELLAERGLLP